MNTDTIKRCPFCGGEVKQDIDDLDLYRNVYSFLCKDCKMEIIYPYSDEEDAIKAWNTRKPMDRIVERLEENYKESQKKYSEEDDWYCKKVYTGKSVAFKDAIEIVKEAGGSSGQ